MDALDRDRTFWRLYNIHWRDPMDRENVLEALDNLEHCEAEPSFEATWNYTSFNGKEWYQCSHCDAHAGKKEDGTDYLSPRCPECGAVMLVWR